MQQFLRRRHPDERGDVNVHESRHQVLAIEPIQYASVPGDNVPEVLDFERPLEPGREEPAERADDRRKQREGDRVPHERVSLERRKIRTKKLFNFFKASRPKPKQNQFNKSNSVTEKQF